MTGKYSVLEANFILEEEKRTKLDSHSQLFKASKKPQPILPRASHWLSHQWPQNPQQQGFLKARVAAANIHAASTNLQC